MMNDKLTGTYYFFCAYHPKDGYKSVYFSFAEPDQNYPDPGRVMIWEDILKADRFSKSDNDTEFFIKRMQAIQKVFDRDNFDLSTLTLKRIEMKVEEADEFLKDPKWRVYLKENAMKKLTAQEVSILELGDTKMLTRLSDDSAYEKPGLKGFFSGGRNA